MSSRDERRAIWRQMLEIYSQEVYSIGPIGAVPQPVVANQRLRNIPDNAVFNWEPGAQFGIYHPDTFRFAEHAG